jgi:DNA polymerase-1
VRSRLILLDGPPLIYRNYYSPGMRNLKTSNGMKSGAFYGFLHSLLVLKKRFEESYFFVTFDEGHSGRNEIFPSYKNNPEKSEPLQRQFQDVKTFLASAGIPMYNKVPLEADDVISVTTHLWLQSHKLHNVFIVSSDRDYFQLVSERVLLCDDKAKTFYGPQEVENLTGVKPFNWLNYKCLRGDTSDKIPGIKGFTGKKGDKGDLRAIQECVLGIHAVPDEYRDEYRRNYALMRLPKTFTELKTVDASFAYVCQVTLDNYIRSMMNDEIPMNSKNAQALLDKYECQSMKLEDFFI